jgi:hypothetical protein
MWLNNYFIHKLLDTANRNCVRVRQLCAKSLNFKLKFNANEEKQKEAQQTPK